MSGLKHNSHHFETVLKQLDDFVFPPFKKKKGTIIRDLQIVVKDNM